MKKQAQRGRAAGLRPHSSHGQGGVWLQGCPPGRPGFPQGHESGASRGVGRLPPTQSPGLRGVWRGGDVCTGESPTPGLSPGQAPLSLCWAVRAPKEGGSASSVDTASGGRRSRPWEAAPVNTGRLSKPQGSDHGEGACRNPCNDKVAQAACPGSRPHSAPARWGPSGGLGAGYGGSGPSTRCFCQIEIPRNCQVRWLKR